MSRAVVLSGHAGALPPVLGPSGSAKPERAGVVGMPLFRLQLCCQWCAVLSPRRALAGIRWLAAAPAARAFAKIVFCTYWFTR